MMVNVAVDDARLEAAVAVAKGDGRAGLCHMDWRGRLSHTAAAAQLQAWRAGRWRGVVALRAMPQGILVAPAQETS
jgi:hypothetical protein